MSDTKTPEVKKPTLEELTVMLQKLQAEHSELKEKHTETSKKLETELATPAHHQSLQGHSALNPIIAQNEERAKADAIAELESRLAKLRDFSKIPKAPPTGDKMPTANLRLRLDKDNDVPLKNVTPAEVLYLVVEHHLNVKDNPIVDLSEQEGLIIETGVKDGKIQRRYGNTSDVMNILKRKYRNDKVKKLFPGAIPQLPKTFNEAIKFGLETVSSGETLSEQPSFSFGDHKNVKPA